MLDEFPNSRWLMIPECDHVVCLERPDVFFPTLEPIMRAKSTDFRFPLRSIRDSNEEVVQ